MGGESRFVWHDLMTTDVEAAKRFYGELFGWRFERGEGSPYEHISSGGRPIGGMMTLDPAHGAPPHWIGYISVDDVDAALAAVGKQGGSVYVPKTDIPTTGQFAVAADPTGGVFAPFHYTGAHPSAEPETPPPFTFCWDELMSGDPDAAARFYGAVFGWRAEHVEMPGFGRYTLFKRPGAKDAKGEEKNAGGLMQRPPEVPRTFWLTYVNVPDTDAVVAKAQQLGATPTSPPMDVPGVGRFSVLLDPQHAVFAILAPSR